MDILYIRILFFCLVPFGIFLIVKGIQFIRKTFYGKVIFSLPFNDKTGQFTIENDGSFSIWQHGPLFKKTLADQFRPMVINLTTNQQVALSSSLMGLRTSEFSEGASQLFTFKAQKGTYQLTLEEGTSVSWLQRKIGQFIPVSNIDPAKYVIQVRESQPWFISAFCIPMLLVGIGCIVGGAVVGSIADQIFL